MTARIPPLEPPYTDEVAENLARWMPPSSPVPPLALFRTIARHPMLREVLRQLGSGFRTQGVLPPRIRELAILRVTARCDARYEWSAHVTAFARAVGLDDATIQRTVRATAAELAAATQDDADGDALVLRICDELHDTSTVSDALFQRASARFGAEGMLELAALAGYYHLVSYLVRVAGVEHEPWAAPFPTPP